MKSREMLEKIILYTKVKHRILCICGGIVGIFLMFLSWEIGKISEVRSELNIAKAERATMEARFGARINDIVEAEARIRDLTTQLEKGNQINQDIQKDKYLECISWVIIGRYSAWGEKKSKEDYKEIRTLVNLAFECSSKLFQLKYVKCYASTVRLCALQELASCRKESNFTLYPKPYKNSNGSYDWGPFQVNDVNLNFCFNEMKKLGIWSPDSNTWATDPRNNAFMRIIIDETRTAEGKDEKNKGHWDRVALDLLLRVPGWENITF